MIYKFKVKALNSFGESDWSIEITRTKFTVPDPPTGLTLSRATGSCLSFSWTAPNNGGSTISYYRIEQSINNGQAWSYKGDSYTTSYTASGLTPST